MDIPFIDLKSQYKELKSAIDLRIGRVLEHGQYIMGPEVRELEERLASFVDVKHCITVGSGTDALLISLMALGIGPGDEVITTPFTFVATAEMVVLLGARPVYVDIDPVTYNIDPSKIVAAITPKTRAIIPVSIFGQCADMDAINAIAVRHGLTVIEDAAQSFGATYKGRRSCGLSTVGTTSFFPSKPLGCYGDGGAIFTNDDQLAVAMREVRVHGQQRRYFHTRIGVGGRMDTLQCAVVLAKMDRFDWEISQREKMAKRYDRLLASLCPEVKTPVVATSCTSVYGQYTILAPNRDALAMRLNERGVPTAVHYPIPLNRQPAYQDNSIAFHMPVSDDVSARVLSLPMGPDLSESNQDKVVAALQAALLEETV